MSLVIRKGVPVRTSTSKSSTTRASRAQDKIRQVSPMIAKGCQTICLKVCWEDLVIGALMEQA